MAAGLWFYMTPQDPKPSMHDVMTGNFTPTAADDAANITNGFGTTINIINGGLECNSWSEKARSRGDYYLKWLDFFGLDPEDNLGCETQKAFPDDGYGDQVGYFDKTDDTPDGTCSPVNYQTQYAITTRDDYKRCVCRNFGNGEEDCKFDES